MANNRSIGPPLFHLLVAYRGWPDAAGTIPTDRIYIKGNDEIGSLFLKNGKLDIDQIVKIPALLVSETGGPGPQFAKVARITGIGPGPRETAIQYAVDSGPRPISNQDLEDLAPLLGISRRVLTTTHWAIQEGELFKALLLNQQRSLAAPRLFSVESISQPQADLVSVMMPFSTEFKSVYSALDKASASVGLQCKRADDVWKHDTIVQDIVDLIARARVVICDCSGRNPNVFYEVGIAHALGKETVLITQSETDVPFDLRHLRYIPYLNNREGRKKLSEAVQARLRTIVAPA